MYRADSYFYKCPQNDWCETKWDSGSTSGCYLYQLLMFVDTTNMKIQKNYDKQHPYLALVHTSGPDKNQETREKTKIVY